MKKLALSVAALALATGSALAADLPTRKGPAMLPPPPPPPMWTGFYVGLNAGYTWANSNQQTIGVGPVAATPTWASVPANLQTSYLATFATVASASGVNGGNNGGFIGGGQIGYNWQFYNSLVAGLEADIQGVANNSGTRSFSRAALVPGGIGTDEGFISAQSVRGNLQYIGTVRGRLGWLFTPTLLLYGTGGLAYGGVTLNSAALVAPTGTLANFAGAAVGGVNFSNTQVGWTAGGGLEWMFWPNWSAKVEYLYYDLGSVTQNFSLASGTGPFNGDPNAAAIFGGQVRARINGNLVRAGVNYHFNWGSPAPVVAKY
jgi:outer membrane immunogenic protein